MNDTSIEGKNRLFQERALEAAVRIGILFLLVSWSFQVIRPFILPVLWGAIIAVAIYPIFLKLESLLGGRRKLAATLLTVLAIAMLVTPAIMLSGSLIENSQKISRELSDGSLDIPPPSDNVRNWPVVGEELHSVWSQASSNLGATLKRFKPQLEAGGKWVLSAAGGVGGAILQFIIAIIIAGGLLVNAHTSSRAATRLAERLTGDKSGDKFIEIAEATIRSVAQGVLGVALIQATLASIGMLVIGVPYAGIWTLLILLVAVVQLPPILVLGPVIAYVFTITSTGTAVAFMIWSILVSMSDALLKPLFLGRGMDIPMLVILLGAIGGLLMSGIIGLFVGAVVLAVSYTLFKAWLEHGTEQDVVED